MGNNTYPTVYQPLSNGCQIIEHLLPNDCTSVCEQLNNYQNSLFTSEIRGLVKGWLRVVELSKKSLPMHIYIHRHRDIHIHRDRDNSRRGNTSVAKVGK
jgi:hypothetical protein